jgi:hypothetical protein
MLHWDDARGYPGATRAATAGTPSEKRQGRRPGSRSGTTSVIRWDHTRVTRAHRSGHLAADRVKHDPLDGSTLLARGILDRRAFHGIAADATRGRNLARHFHRTRDHGRRVRRRPSPCLFL